MTTPTYMAALNTAQRKAATFGELRGGDQSVTFIGKVGEKAAEKGVDCGPLLIIAGAGTGKTNTLAHRVAHLVMNGVDPGRILMLTFSRRAAQEMRRRARDIVKQALNEPLGGLNQVLAQRLSWSGTFHSMANRLLRHYARHLKLDPQFTVIDRGDSADLMDAVRQELGFDGKEQRFPRRDTCLAIYSHRVNTRKTLQQSLDEQYPWCAQWESELTQLYRAYVQRKQAYGILDYDDLLLYWHIMMGETKLAQHVSGHFDHVLVDEYQDTNALQAQILHALRPDGRGLTVVGDDAQAIYSFRAATVDNILNFPDQFQPRAEVITLAQNYRSSQQVLDSSNALMADAPRQFRKHLLAARGAGQRPRMVTVDDLAAQAESVCMEVLRRREAQVPLHRQAVLFRSGSHSDLLEIELARRQIPFVKYGGLRFLEAAHVKDLLAVLRWVDNPRNHMAAFRALQLLPGMGPANAQLAIDHMAAQEYTAGSLASFRAPHVAPIEIEKLSTLQMALTDPRREWPGQVHLVREWYKPHLERIYESVHTRIGDLDQLELLSVQFTTRERFITELTLDPPEAASDLAAKPNLDEDFLVLSTIHSAKGMEWDTVYLLNVVDGSFPSEFATRKPELIEEERRLLYVAMTRARNELMLYCPLKFPITSQPKHSDGHVYGGRSRFLTEKVLRTFDATVLHGAHGDEVALGDAGSSALDVNARLKEMW
ncbi:MAG TPA: ATP-dependent helicase [Steroidobacteraceae bacterium]|jgi:DNA helicase-2/ATP-dependent DNA helicase PcrA|nr:ATP-dependent helicase [Steroidobacteraceae bacterium]